MHESRLLDTIDILARISWPVRVAIRALYSSPYQMRLLGHYELDVTSPSGVKEHIAGEGPIEVHYY